MAVIVGRSILCSSLRSSIPISELIVYRQNQMVYLIKCLEFNCLPPPQYLGHFQVVFTCGQWSVLWLHPQTYTVQNRYI